MQDESPYSNAITTFDALRAAIPKFKAKKAFIRITDSVTPTIQREMGPSAPAIGANRDRAVCALVNKACNTHAAIRLLADAGHGDDAMALGRVILGEHHHPQVASQSIRFIASICFASATPSSGNAGASW